MDRVQVTALLTGFAIIVGVIELMRRDRVREEYAILWLMLALCVIGLSVSRSVLEWLAQLVGIFYPPSALFAVALIGCLALFMHFSIVMSRLTQHTVALAQELALLKMEADHPRRPASGGAVPDAHAAPHPPQ